MTHLLNAQLNTKHGVIDMERIIIFLIYIAAGLLTSHLIVKYANHSLTHSEKLSIYCVVTLFFPLVWAAMILIFIAVLLEE